METMTRLRILGSRLLGLFTMRRRDAELSDEIQSHLDALTDEFVRSGMTPAHARAAARRAFGGGAQVTRRYRDQRGLPLVDSLVQDLRYGLRMMRRAPAFTIVAVLSLALGIGANTAVFSVINALLLKTLPVDDPGALVRFTVDLPIGTNEDFSYPLYRDFTTHTGLFTGVAASGGIPRMRMAIGDFSSAETELVRTERVSGNFFAVLGVKAVVGRTLTDDDDRPENARAVAVISYGLWTRTFARDPAAVGRSLTLNDVPFTIVGVAPLRFSGFQVGANPDLWFPLQMIPQLTRDSQLMNQRTSEWLVRTGRFRPEVPVERARAEMDAFFQRDVAESFQRRAARLGSAFTPGARQAFMQRSLHLVPGGTGTTPLRGQFERPLVILMVLVGL